METNTMSNKPEFDIDIENIDLKSGDEQINQEDVVIQPTDQDDMETVSAVVDENDITIGDKRSPIVMLFGPRSSGKSMTLVRLSRYLRDCGYTIKVDKTFKSDAKYKEKCEKFLKDLDTREALSGNAYTDFLLVKVIKQGTTICQFLEAPGEHYFDPKDVSARNFPPYMTEIIRKLGNRKIWAFITEAEWDVNNSVKKSYIRRIANCKAQLVRPTDRFIILYNKIDQKDELFDDGRIHLSSAERTMKEEYDGLAKLFVNTNPITSIWRKFNYKFVPFCTGYYFTEMGRLTYKESEDLYPRMLWDALMKSIKG